MLYVPSVSAVLVAADDPLIRRMIETALTGAGLSASTFETVAALLAAFDEDSHVCILDLKLAGIDGHASLADIKRRNPRTEVIFLTAVGDVPEAIRAAAFDCFTQPFDPRDLVRSVTKALALSRVSRSNDEILHAISHAGPALELLGKSPAMEAIKALIERIAPLEEAVLLTGESGTGKTLAARAVHAASRRKDGPFLAVSVASVPRELLDSELFGHEKGAFPGAFHKRLGRVELASGGTLFLDEIGELPLEVQAKLLAFLQDRTFSRIGGRRSLEADARVVASTSQDLPKLCREGHFREDLFYRLNVVPLELPPLRTHREDVAIMAERYLDGFAKRHGTKPVSLSPQAMDALIAYPWPGNVRELEITLSHVATLTPAGSRIEKSDLPPVILGQVASDRVSGAPSPNGFDFTGRTLDEIEKAALVEALARHAQNRIQTAKALGVSEKTIYNMMRRYSLTTPGGTRPPMGSAPPL